MHSRAGTRSILSDLRPRHGQILHRRNAVALPHREWCNRKEQRGPLRLPMPDRAPLRARTTAGARLALFSPPPPDDETSFVTDVSLTADECADAALLADVLCDDSRAPSSSAACAGRGRSRVAGDAVGADDEDDNDLPARFIHPRRSTRRRSATPGVGAAADWDGTARA
jgi:hypothetical protein